MHATRIVRSAHWRGGDRWTARCECGWAGKRQTVYVRAEMDGQHHERTATYPAPGGVSRG